MPSLRSVMPSAAGASGVGSRARVTPVPALRASCFAKAPAGGTKTTEEQMKSKQATARVSKNGKFMIVNFNGQTAILNANLVRYLFDVPYTRKDGTRVSASQIFEMKQSAQVAYDEKVKQAIG